MNLTLDEFLRSLERSVDELPALFAEWDAIDPELYDLYASQLGWLLRARHEATAMATGQGRVIEVAVRLAFANAKLLRLRDSLVLLMGLDLDDILQWHGLQRQSVSISGAVDDLASNDNRYPMAA